MTTFSGIYSSPRSVVAEFARIPKCRIGILANSATNKHCLLDQFTFRIFQNLESLRA